MSWFAVGSAAVTVVGGYMSNKSANKGAKNAASAQERSQQLAIDEQRAAREQGRTDLMPYSQFGQQGIGGLNALNSGDYSGFLNSPDYQAAMGAGVGALDRSASSRGSLFSGAHEKDLNQFGQANAAQYLGNYRSSLFQQLGGGQSAAAGQGGFSMNAANQIGNGYNNIGNAQAGAYNQIGQNNAQFAAGTAGALNGLFQDYANRGSQYTPPASGYSGINGSGTYSW